MTEELFKLVGSADADFSDVEEYTAAIIALTNHKNATTVLLDLLRDSVSSLEKTWFEIEHSPEYKEKFGERNLLLKAYEEQRRAQS